MYDILTALLALVTAGYVLAPLLAKTGAEQIVLNQETGVRADLLFQKQLAQDTVSDLDFDLQTGKLDTDDHDDLVQAQQKLIDGIENALARVQGGRQDETVKKLEAEIQQISKNLRAQTATTCAHCGAPYKSGDTFCSRCGTRLRV